MKTGLCEEIPELTFQLDRKDLYDIIGIIAGTRLFRKVAIPVLAGLVFLGHSLDGNYLKGLLWGLGVVFLYWGFSRGMILLHVFAGSNETLLVPQQVRLIKDRMFVSSEHSEEDFSRPDPSEVKTTDRYLLIPMGKNSLVFMKRSFPDPGEFEVLKNWLLGESAGEGKDRATLQPCDQEKDPQP